MGFYDGFRAAMEMRERRKKEAMEAELREAATSSPPDTLGPRGEGSAEDVQAQLDTGAGVGEARTLAGSRGVSIPPTAEQVFSGRRQAQLGVLEKHGDLEGANRIRAQDQQIAESAKRSAREDKVFSRQEKGWADEDAYKADKGSAFKSSNFGTKSEAYSQAMAAYHRARDDYDAKVSAGDATAVAPIEPAKPMLSMGEAMLDHANSLSVEIKHGRASTADLMKFVDMQKQAMDEGYIKALRTALSPGVPDTQILDLINSNGKMKVDPASLVKSEWVERPGGAKSRLMTFKQPNGQTRTIDALAELDALGKAGDIFERAYKDHSMRVQDQQLAISRGQLGVAQAAGARAAAADGRAAAEFAAGAPERQLRQTVAGLQLDQLGDDPAKAAGAKAKLDAVGKGLGSTDKDQPSEVKLAAAMVKAGLAPDMKSGLQMALTRKGDSPEEMHKEFVAASMKTGLVKAADAVAQADEVMTAMGYSKKGGKWAGGGGDAAAGSKPASEGDAMSQAKAAIAAGADPAEVNKRLKAWGFKAL